MFLGRLITELSKFIVLMNAGLPGTTKNLSCFSCCSLVNFVVIMLNMRDRKKIAKISEDVL